MKEVSARRSLAIFPRKFIIIKLDWKLPFTGELKIEREMILRDEN